MTSQPVYTLLCHRDIPMARFTLPTIIANLSVGQRLYVVDDGSFTKGDWQEVSSMSPSIVIVEPAEREEIVAPQIALLNHCQNYRTEFPFSIKLIDIPLIAAAAGYSRFIYTDSDIVYGSSCQQLFRATDSVYLRTDAIKLSVKLQHALMKYRWRVPLRFNAGFLSTSVVNHDLQFIEYFLGLPDTHQVPWLTEQTCWALLFGRSGEPLFCPNERQFVCRETVEALDDQARAVHMIANLKPRVKEFADEFTSRPVNPVEMRFEPSRFVNLADWACKSLHRLARLPLR